MSDLAMKSWKSAALPWEDMVIPVTGNDFQRKHLMQDGDTAMAVMLVRYPAGTITPWHKHPCAHGLYVIEGTLHTQDGTYAAGDFVWYPEGNIGEHGATAAGPVTLLFVTNKPIGIAFTDGPKP